MTKASRREDGVVFIVPRLTGRPPHSLLDEATAAAEAMSMCVALSKNGKKKGAMTFFADSQCHPQTIAVVKTRCEALNIDVIVGDATTDDLGDACIGVLWQYPNTRGDVVGDAAGVSARAKAAGALSVVAADPLALTLLPAPGTFGADICVGSMQRYGVPMGFGGPHAAYMATSEKYARRMPGRIIGETVEANERKGRALRMAMQTREQHIRRDKATSNICTAQALLANMAAAYAIYHGPDGLQDIAKRCLGLATAASKALNAAGIKASEPAFDTIVVSGVDSGALAQKAEQAGFNLRVFGPDEVGLSFGETVTREDLVTILEDIFEVKAGDVDALADTSHVQGRANLLPHQIFNTHKSESQMMRYLKQLEDKDLALNHSMISLGSCTMKLNSVSEMLPVTWPEFSDMHPFAPVNQTEGYIEMIASLNADLCKITGFDAVSVQPNSGASGEYAGLLAIRAYQESLGEGHRNICLIPVSAHGTNPASAVMAGLKVVIVKSDDAGNIDLADFTAKAEKHKDNLSAIMVTYPSTYGVFEETITDLTRITHECGGQVYMDGANLNAQASDSAYVEAASTWRTGAPHAIEA